MYVCMYVCVYIYIYTYHICVYWSHPSAALPTAESPSAALSDVWPACDLGTSFIPSPGMFVAKLESLTR